MLLSVIRAIPFLGSAFSFPLSVCLRAGKETFSLWFMSSLPLLYSAFSKMMSGKTLGAVAAEEVNIKALFVYISAFLAPVLYVLIERLIYPRKQKIFTGSLWIFLGTLAIVCFSSWLFDNEKITDSSRWRVACYVMYLVSIYFWWLAIADNRNGDFAYEAEVTQDENAFAALAAKRHQEGTK